MEITEDQFTAFEAVRAGGSTNMLDTPRVMELADLSREEVEFIRDHYDELLEQYPDAR